MSALTDKVEQMIGEIVDQVTVAVVNGHASTAKDWAEALSYATEAFKNLDDEA